MKISVVISTRNREASLARTLTSAKPIADEIIVVDNESTDNTRAVARKFGAKTFSRPNNIMLNVNKNFGFGKATGDWILCLDDDEVVPPDLAEELKASIDRAATDVAGFWIPRKNIIFGKWIEHGIWWPDRQLRVFRKGSGKYPERHVHEYIEVTGKTETLTRAFVHYNYDTISQYLSKMQDIYTESEVAKFVAIGYTLQWADAVRFPASDFMKLYFAQGGYKDGLHGLVLAMLQAFYSFIIFVKLWERAKFRDVSIFPADAIKELAGVAKEGSYWTDTVSIAESANPLTKLWFRLRRRMRRLS